MNNTCPETVAEWMTRTGRTPARVPALDAPTPLVLPGSYRDWMTAAALARWEEEVASRKRVTLAPVDQAAPCSNGVEPDPLAAPAERAADVVALWLHRGGYLRCEMVGAHFDMLACAKDGRGVAFDNRGMRGWYGTTGEREPWDAISATQRLYWASDERLDHVLVVVGKLHGVTEQAKRTLQTLLVGASIHMEEHHRAQARQYR